MNFRYGAYPLNQRTALVILTFATAALCWFGSRLPSVQPAAEATIAAARALRTELKAAEQPTFRQPPEAFAFDPNTVSAEELVRLGLSERQAASWLKFRGNKRNAFRSPEDIGKLYVVSDADKARLIALAYVAEQREEARPQVQSFAFDPNTVAAPALQRLGLSAKQAAAFVNYRSKAKYGQAFRTAKDLRRLNTLSDRQKDHLIALAVFPSASERPGTSPPQRFAFDPNTISADSFALLGFPAWQARALLRYRGDRPGTFRRAEDLRRVKALDSSLVEAVLALVDLAPATDAAPATAPPTTNSYVRTPPPPAGSFDVNRADTAAWKTLPGIGSYRARRIVRFREALGGFCTIEQVGTTYGLPDSTFNAIRPYLKVSPVTRPLAINHATYEALNSHPYINRNLANAIVQNRAKFGRFNGPEDLRRLRLITEENLPRLLPYLSFE